MKANDFLFVVVLLEKKSFGFEQIIHFMNCQLVEELKATRWIGGGDVGALSLRERESWQRGSVELGLGERKGCRSRP